MSDFSTRPSNSASPADRASNGGVSLLGHVDLHEEERAGHAMKPYHSFKLPQWNGPAQTASRVNASTDPLDKVGSATNHHVKLSGGASNFNPAASKGPSPIRALTRNSTADPMPTIVVSPVPESHKGKVITSQKPIGTRNADVKPPRPRAVFTTDVGPNVKFPGGHYVKLENVTAAKLDSELKFLSTEYGWDCKLRGHKAPPPGESQKFLTLFYCFDDLDDAARAVIDVEIVSQMVLSFITQAEYAAAPSTHGTQVPTSFYDGQLIFVAKFDGLTSEFKSADAAKVVRKLAEQYGNVYVFTDVQTATYPNIEFRCEYNKISSAKAALEKLTQASPAIIGDWTVYAVEMPNCTAHPSSADSTPLPAMDAGHDADTGSPKRTNGTSECFQSATGRTAWRVDENGNKIPTPPPKTLPKVPQGPAHVVVTATPARERYNSAPNPYTPVFAEDSDTHRSISWHGTGYQSIELPRTGPQTVDIEKILEGLDVRTTLMMRNIPNKMNCHQLKVFVDLTSEGKYDFLYLRIDFQQGTNVGYAFINFPEPTDIAAFAMRRMNLPWQEGNKRLVELSYATIQGVDCLIEKFRNSAIMSEYPDFRPKLFFTKDTATKDKPVGTEMPFPEPNNLSKKQRSHDNAGQIGLYAPRSGHLSRERLRRSQYDRGTPAQIQEDAYYHTQDNQMIPYQNAYGYVEPAYGMGGPRMPAGLHNMPPTYYGMPPFAGGYVNGPAYPIISYDAAEMYGAAQYNGNQGYVMPASPARMLTNGRVGRGKKQVMHNYTHLPQVVEDEDEYAHGNGYYSHGYPAHSGMYGYAHDGQY